MVKLFEGAMRNKKYIMKAGALALFFWIIQFTYQYYVFSPGVFEDSVVRSFSFTGATLITLALIIGPLSRLSKYNFLAHRRTLGVWGFTFIIMHYLSVMSLYFSFDPNLFMEDTYFKVMLLGSIAFWIYVPLYLTSTDWALAKIGFRKWKFIHRLIYLAYIFSMVHYTLIVQYVEFSFARALLLALTVIAVVLQISVFLKTIAKTRSRKDAIIGFLIVLFGLALFYAAFVLRLF